MAADAHHAIDAVWRIESPRLIAGLVRFTRDLDYRAYYQSMDLNAAYDRTRRLLTEPGADMGRPLKASVPSARQGGSIVSRGAARGKWIRPAVTRSGSVGSPCGRFSAGSSRVSGVPGAGSPPWVGGA